MRGAKHIKSNQMHYVTRNKTDNKTHVISDVNTYMFRHQGAISEGE